jgi:hypothetical protein
MSEEAILDVQRPPWHLWVVGILGLLWNLVGAMDYLMTQTQNESYMSQFTPEQLEYFYGFPTWVVATWALAVWGGVVGTVLLLVKRRVAAPVLLVSLVAMILTSFHNFVLTNGLEVMGGVLPLAFSALVFVVAIGLWYYARTMARRGVLR